MQFLIDIEKYILIRERVHKTQKMKENLYYIDAGKLVQAYIIYF